MRVKKTVLVTGGAGFIGSNFIIYMLSKYKDYKIINLDKLTYAGNIDNLSSVKDNKLYEFVNGDICDKKLIYDLFNKYDLDFVVNFAAESHVDRSIEQPDVFITTNIVGTVNILNALRDIWGKGGVDCGKKFLQVSTDEVYGSLGKTGYFTEKTPVDPHSPYSASKASADMIIKAYHDTFKIPVNITRCSNNYGPFQFPEKLIPLMIINALKKKPLPVYGDGLNVRDWIYVEDHCRAIDKVLHYGNIGEIYNIGGNTERTNIEIVELIIDYLNKHVDKSIDDSLISYVEDRKGHDRRYAVDATKIKEELGWVPQTQFNVGIEKTIRWYVGGRFC